MSTPLIVSVRFDSLETGPLDSEYLSGISILIRFFTTYQNRYTVSKVDIGPSKPNPHMILNLILFLTSNFFFQQNESINKEFDLNIKIHLF